jgi:hypothetical protein
MPRSASKTTPKRPANPKQTTATKSKESQSFALADRIDEEGEIDEAGDQQDHAGPSGDVATDETTKAITGEVGDKEDTAADTAASRLPRKQSVR